MHHWFERAPDCYQTMATATTGRCRLGRHRLVQLVAGLQQPHRQHQHHFHTFTGNLNNQGHYNTRILVCNQGDTHNRQLFLYHNCHPHHQHHHSLYGYGYGYGSRSTYQLPSTTTTTTREFAVQARNKGNDGGRTHQPQTQPHTQQQEGPVLSNEKLVQALLRYTRAPTASHIQVRMLVDNTTKKTKPSSSINNDDTGPGLSTLTTDTHSAASHSAAGQLVSLEEAIQTALELEKDLIEVSIQQQTPVVRVANLRSLQYRMERKKKAHKKINLASSGTKEFRFNAVIDDNDLARKIASIRQTLERGQLCLVQVRCKKWQAANKPDFTARTVDRVLEQLSPGSYELVVPVDMHPERTMARVSLRPSSSSSKKN
jgi:translation initiation factor IF-3